MKKAKALAKKRDTARAKKAAADAKKRAAAAKKKEKAAKQKYNKLKIKLNKKLGTVTQELQTVKKKYLKATQTSRKLKSLYSGLTHRFNLNKGGGSMLPIIIFVIILVVGISIYFMSQSTTEAAPVEGAVVEAPAVEEVVA